MATRARTRVPHFTVIGDLDFVGHIDTWLDVLEWVGSQLRSGDFLQVRAKTLTEARRKTLIEARKRTQKASQSGVRVLLNGTVSEAVAHEFDGVHWAEAMIPNQGPALPKEVWATAAVHDLEAAQRAVAAGARALMVSPIFDVAAKGLSGRGVALLRQVAKNTSVDIIALGGLTPERVGDCITHGATGVASLSGALQQPTQIHRYLAALSC